MTQRNLPNENSVYETERLIIQPVSVEDREFIFELYNRPKFIQYIGNRGVNSIADAENYIINRFLPQFENPVSETMWP